MALSSCPAPGKAARDLCPKPRRAIRFLGPAVMRPVALPQQGIAEHPQQAQQVKALPYLALIQQLLT